MSEQQQDQILEASTSSMLATISDGTMATWTEDKKTEFISLFRSRSKAAQYILKKAALIIIEKAAHRHFIGPRVKTELDKKAQAHGLYDEGQVYNKPTMVGGRNVTDLDIIAAERAKAILNELPAVKDAVKIIDPDTATLMDKRDRLILKLKVLKEALEELPTRINMRDPEFADITVKEFLKGIKELENKRTKMAREMCDIGADGQALDESINKRLYNGLPGLSDAVKKVAIQHIERSQALDATTRRVEEKVKFGDDEGATALLQGFERDEIRVSDDIKSEFANAMKKLSLAAGKKKRKMKALPKRSK